MNESLKPNVKLSSPWMNHYRKIKAIFGNDPDVTVKFDNQNCSCKLYVHGQDKADAIAAILPSEATFGKVTMTISVVPDNVLKANQLDIYEKAFEGNPAFIGTKKVDFAGFALNYVIFKKEVVQYFNDDLSDANRVESTLYEDIAKDVFGEGTNVFFSTDVGDNVNDF